MCVGASNISRPTRLKNLNNSKNILSPCHTHATWCIYFYQDSHIPVSMSPLYWILLVPTVTPSHPVTWSWHYEVPSQCRATVFDTGLTLKQHCVNACARWVYADISCTLLVQLPNNSWNIAHCYLRPGASSPKDKELIIYLYMHYYHTIHLANFFIFCQTFMSVTFLKTSGKSKLNTYQVCIHRTTESCFLIAIQAIFSQKARYVRPK